MANETYALFATSEGSFKIKLFADEVPNTVKNFIDLVEGAKTGKPFYDGLVFHRVIPDFMIQGGCPEGSGRGGPGYRFGDEIVPALRHERGVLSMANAGPATNGSQFFITHVATPWLDGKHTVFGKVEGAADQAVVDAIRGGDAIESVRIEGDASGLLAAQKAQVERWNSVLDGR